MWSVHIGSFCGERKPFLLGPVSQTICRDLYLPLYCNHAPRTVTHSVINIQPTALTRPLMAISSKVTLKINPCHSVFLMTVQKGHWLHETGNNDSGGSAKENVVGDTKNSTDGESLVYHISTWCRTPSPSRWRQRQVVGAWGNNFGYGVQNW